jgi:methionyl aminopeptidase
MFAKLNAAELITTEAASARTIQSSEPEILPYVRYPVQVRSPKRRAAHLRLVYNCRSPTQCRQRHASSEHAPTMSISIKTDEDIRGMRIAGRLAAEVLDYITPFVKPGVTTAELDRLCHEYMTNVQDSIPAPLNYCPPGYTPYPKAVCTSVNDVICHGIPGDKALKNGDAVNIDVTIIKNGYHGDTSRMFYAGQPSIMAKRLGDITYECMWLGISKIRPGAHLGDIGYVIQQHAEKAGYSVVREFCGHGIGKVFHEEPQVLHYGRPGTLEKIEAGMIFTVEPMINAGRREIREMGDGWTIRTKDRSLSAQWEHTVLVTETGYEVLTVSPGMPAPPAFITSVGQIETA